MGSKKQILVLTYTFLAYLAGVIVADLVLGIFFAPAKPRPEIVAPIEREETDEERGTRSEERRARNEEQGRRWSSSKVQCC